MNELENVFKHYCEFTPTTAIYPDAGKHTFLELMSLFLGMQGELQEWVESNYDEKEAGDVFWYMSHLCRYHHWNLYELYQSANFMNYRDDDKLPNVFEGLKKYIRDNTHYQPALKENIRYNLAMIKQLFNNDDEIIKRILMKNVDKLTERKNYGALKGSGESIRERMD